MPLISWQYSLNTGIRQVDEEHQMLVGSINKLYDTYQTGNSIETKTAFQEMIDVTILHFRNEEEMLAAHNYRALDAHKQVHQRFVDNLNVLQTRFVRGEDNAIQEAFDILEKWLFRHIKVNDGGYVADMKEKSVK